MILLSFDTWKTILSHCTDRFHLRDLYKVGKFCIIFRILRFFKQTTFQELTNELKNECISNDRVTPSHKNNKDDYMKVVVMTYRSITTISNLLVTNSNRQTKAISTTALRTRIGISDKKFSTITSKFSQSINARRMPPATENKACVKKVPRDSLFVSEPEPDMFGNDDNPNDNPHWSNANWLKSRFHFAFAEWRSSITNFGVLRVLNDDLVQPSRGFGTHGHADMEIATIVLEGELTHKDSMGTQETLGRGSIQFMSAGHGVRHSEFNDHKTLPLRFLQLWIMPRTPGIKPRYGGFDGTTSEAQTARANQWAHVVTWDKIKGLDQVPIKLDQDVNIYIAEAEAGTELDFEVNPGRQAYVVHAEGDSTLTATSASSGFKEVIPMARGESAEAYGDVKLGFKATTKSFWVVVEMKWTGGKSHTA
jgi:redox-sensitive bicupin YhaK (pirin superfamily)